MPTTYKEITEHDRIIYSTRFIPIGARPSFDPNLANPEKTVADPPSIPTETPDTGWTMSDVSKLSDNSIFEINLTDPSSFTFMDSGNQLLVYDSNDSTVNCYTLSSPYSLSGISYVGQCTIVSDVVEMWVDDTGTSAFFLRNISEVGGVNKYTMSTPFDITTLTYDSRISVGEGYWKGMYVSTNGYHLYVGSSKGFIKHFYMNFPLNLGWINKLETVDISGANSIDGIVINPAGTYLYIIDASSDILYQYNLETAYYITDHTYNNKSLDLSGIGVVSLYIEDDEYADILGIIDDKIYKYKISLSWEIYSTATWADTGEYFNFNLGTTQPASLWISEAASKIYVGEGNGGTMFEYSFTGSNLSTAIYTGESYELEGSLLGFSPDGTKMYGVKYIYHSGAILQHVLSTPWDISTASLGYTLATGTTTGGVFNKDGTKFIEFTNRFYYSSDSYVRLYDLTQAWDLSTATQYDEIFLGEDWLGFKNDPKTNPGRTQVYFRNGYSTVEFNAVSFPDLFGDPATNTEIISGSSIGNQAWGYCFSENGQYYYRSDVNAKTVEKWTTDAVSI